MSTNTTTGDPKSEHPFYPFFAEIPNDVYGFVVVQNTDRFEVWRIFTADEMKRYNCTKYFMYAVFNCLYAPLSRVSHIVPEDAKKTAIEYCNKMNNAPQPSYQEEVEKTLRIMETVKNDVVAEVKDAVTKALNDNGWRIKTALIQSKQLEQ